ncbi:MAG: hypothetical protein QXO64_07735 [Thermofilaceae archaeon]
MYGDEHERLTELAVSALIGYADEPAVRQLLAQANSLILASSTPDKLPEYVYELDEELKKRKVRVPHHTCPSFLILRKLLKVRKAVLRGRLGDEEVRELGYALHYLQDRCVPPPGSSGLHRLIERRVHEELERLISDCPLEAVEVRGYRRLSQVVRGQRPADDPCLSVRCAATLTYAALYAVFANPVRAYPEFMARARAFRKLMLSWRGSVHAMLATAALGLNTLMLLALLSVNNHFLMLLPVMALALFLPYSAVVCALILIAAFATSQTTMLRMLYNVTQRELVTLGGGLSLPILTLSSVSPALLLPPALLLLAVVLPLLSKDFREIRDEIPWFLWD